ncbi:tetratricopeptide repeat protein [Candidatus Bandiella euplotis]|uniref:Tetratricopeptide repeat protein n=1 Tax=Candidatus Bandiella euplotis TaxID=1664265 RepID=A0ABZ0UJC8_9RICK|nr:hypothetical protein [Candidatus Bandiella woodruffii]WPX96204.1 Tetratricopeptide repeat protein [Candidatus Bandiella woodruffii]
MEAIIRALEERLRKNPHSKKVKRDLAIEYYKESGNYDNNMCKLELYYKCDSSYCEKALMLMEELFGEDDQINQILIKEHYNYSNYFKQILEQYFYVPDFLKKLYKNLNDQYYNEFLYLEKVPKKFLENNPDYSYYLAYSQSNLEQKQKYLEIGKNHLSSMHGLGLLYKHNREYTKALEFFKAGAEKWHLPSIYSLYLLSKDINRLTTYIDSIEEYDGLDENALYIVAFFYFDIKNATEKNKLKNFLHYLASKSAYSTKIISLLKLSPLIDKEDLRSDKIIVIEEAEYHGLDGHALAILGYMSYYKRVIDNKSVQIIDRMQLDKTMGNQPIDKNLREKLHHDFAIKLLKISIEKGYAQANLFLGKIYYADRNYTESKKYLLESLKNESIEAYYILGAISLRDGKYEQAYNYFLQYSKIDPLSKYSICLFHMHGLFVQKNEELAENCLNTLLTENMHIKGLAHYTLAVLNLTNDNNINKAHHHIKAAKENLHDTSYIELVINLHTKNCINVRDVFLNKKEDVYFKYLEATDRLNGKCLSQNKSEAKKIAREILEKNPDDKVLLDCAYTIYKEGKIDDDCVLTLQHLHNFDYVDSHYTPPVLSDLFEEDFLFHLFSNNTDSVNYTPCAKVDL